jgi:nucleotide-binding universal stress UspA family protein
MLTIRKILHATDFSEQSDNAFRLACALARDYAASLVLVHVHSPFVAYGDGMVAVLPADYTDELRQKLQAIDPHDPKVVIERRLLEGDPATEVLRLAREAKCDLIIMGTHGRTGLGRLLIGSVAEEVVRKASCPVLTIKAPMSLEEGSKPVRNAVSAAAPSK